MIHEFNVVSMKHGPRHSRQKSLVSATQSSLALWLTVKLATVSVHRHYSFVDDSPGFWHISALYFYQKHVASAHVRASARC